MTNCTLTFLGGGKIAEAMIAGLVQNGFESTNIQVLNRRRERGDYLRRTYGVLPYNQLKAATDGADVIIVSTKPNDVVDLVRQIDNPDALIVSVAAGISTTTLEQCQVAGAAVVRVMPNTPMQVGKGVCAYARGRFVSDEQLELLVSILSRVGVAVEVKESQMDAVTAMSGSAPAYLYLLVEAMIDAGVNLGLPRETAKELAVGAFAGATAMLEETGKEPAALRADVSSPGGTTIAAIRVFEEHALRGTVYEATEACARRSKELS